MSEIKERPILFSGPMVRAILEGRKTVTRRIVKGIALEWLRPDGFTPEFTADPRNELCPYGKPGERLWVRETWQGPLVDDQEMKDNPRWWKDMARYQDPAHCSYRASGDSCEYVDPDGDLQCRWKPSIHMPRWASRILLEITAVRVERLQDISEEQAEAEGVDFLRHAPDADETLTPKQLFECLWCGINGDDSWNASPWVWVVEFKRVTP